MKTNRIDAFIGKSIATLSIVGCLVGIPYLVHLDNEQALTNTMIDVATCVGADSCMNVQFLSSSLERYSGELDYELMGKEHKTTLGNADFYRLSVEDQTVFVRVDGSKRNTLQFFKEGTAYSENDLVAKYDIH